MNKFGTEKYRKLLQQITPKYIGAVFPIEECPVPFIGKGINEYLCGCESVLIFAATLGEEFDRLLRQLQITDMAGAVVLDSLAGGYLERFLNEKIDTRRFSPGYDDFPLSTNLDIINVLKAQKKIGLCVNDSYMLTPQKSITGIVGINK